MNSQLMTIGFIKVYTLGNEEHWVTNQEITMGRNLPAIFSVEFVLSGDISEMFSLCPIHSPRKQPMKML